MRGMGRDAMQKKPRAGTPSPRKRESVKPPTDFKNCEKRQQMSHRVAGLEDVPFCHREAEYG